MVGSNNTIHDGWYIVHPYSCPHMHFHSGKYEVTRKCSHWYSVNSLDLIFVDNIYIACYLQNGCEPMQRMHTLAAILTQHLQIKLRLIVTYSPSLARDYICLIPRPVWVWEWDWSLYMGMRLQHYKVYGSKSSQGFYELLNNILLAFP